MAASRKMRQAVAYERLAWRRDIAGTPQAQHYRARAARLRREDARDKEAIRRKKGRDDKQR